MNDTRETILITGAGGNIGQALSARLGERYRIIGLDRPDEDDPDDNVGCDLADPASVAGAMDELIERTGGRIASVIHLAAYFDFSGEERPQYEAINVEGTRNLLEGLARLDVSQFVYSGTMLVHEAVRPGERVDEDTPLAPGWAYPKSKARAEEVIREVAPRTNPEMGVVLLHLAGLYDDETAVPTLSHQIARIYERNLKSHVYAGDPTAGQSFIHLDDMLDLFERVVDRRDRLGGIEVILAGEEEAVGYDHLQDAIGELVHGEDHWQTLNVPAPLAKVGAKAEVMAEKPIPDAFDEGEKPFIRPFMIELASDHYALDTAKAREVLGWEAQHSILDGLKSIVAALKADPAGWYEKNGIHPPAWLVAAEARVDDPEALRAAHEAEYRRDHRANLWAHFANMGLGAWLLTSPPLLGYGDSWLALSDVVAGLALIVAGFLSLSWRLPMARFAAAGIGTWVLFAPLLFWTPNGAAYVNATLVGMLAIGFALALKPVPGVAPVASQTGPTVPKGWDYSPSDWAQRIPVIALAVVGLIVSRYLTGYQLESLDGVWEPFFPGTRDGLNGTEDIITSEVSEAWPVPDAGIGGLTYALEILVGVIGSSRRWRTMPWLTLLFGLMIVPLGAISIFFIAIQPIVIGTYSTLALIAAAAMVVQIPYAVDELVATIQFLRRRAKAGQPWLKILFTGDTDAGPDAREDDDFERPPGVILRDMLTGGMTLPWSLAASIGVGALLMLSPLWLSWESPVAGALHICGALAVTVAVSALATVIRIARFLNVIVGAVLIFAPLVTGGSVLAYLTCFVGGLALIVLAVPRGPVSGRYDTMDTWVR
ncbi:NAD-dependent epimerase/dehydratase family protein [Roseobacter sp. HKCCA0434]|uniref:NAD-dependent epimerase/dehydratase family protein n=1 Tax=Roseobacter sp. HKCCA0434 TaxID=3079297 RepID=UPI0029058A32|nr:NAD-dependent epimerase/dehydratase family protein [Roseobacter sp. HKCCA0434]